MRVVIIGPGRIGCGYLTPLFQAAGCEVVLVARDQATTERIGKSGRFAVRITGRPTTNGNGPCGSAAGARFLVETPFTATIGTPDFVEAVAGADLVCTAVGVERVRSLAPALGFALAARPADRPLDVWTVENGDCAPQLEENVREAARRAGGTLPPVGFAGAIADVAVGRGSWRTEGSAEFVSDAFRSLLVDERRLLTGVPALPGVGGTPSFLAHLYEKLYVFNAGHAVSAYFGWLRGHSTIAEAAADPFLRPLIAGAMLEGRRGLLAAHPSLGAFLDGRVAEALARFADPELADPIDRVAREPIRKLAPGDRLLGPAELIMRRTGRVPEYFALAVAGALLYRNEEDEQSCRLEDELERAGVVAVLDSVCGLAPSHPFAQAVAARYRSFIVTPDQTIFPPVSTRTARPAAGPGREATLVGAGPQR
jgi:mannitol-1-phosphate 5-dehydrogenase